MGGLVDLWDLSMAFQDFRGPGVGLFWLFSDFESQEDAEGGYGGKRLDTSIWSAKVVCCFGCRWRASVGLFCLPDDGYWLPGFAASCLFVVKGMGGVSELG